MRYCEYREHMGVKTGRCFAIYKCNKYPVRFFREAPPPKTVLTLNELPYIMGVEGEIMPKIYERNPDTDEIRERDFNDYQTAADSMRDMNRDDHLNRDKEPNPYRNEMAEAVEILQRMNDKLDRLLEQQQEHLEKEHPRDDGK